MITQQQNQQISLRKRKKWILDQYNENYLEM